MKLRTLALCDDAWHPVEVVQRGLGALADSSFDFMALDDPQADVFLHTRSAHGVQPAGWTRTEGKGRVCVLTPGHNLQVWLHPAYQKLLLNALRWTAKLN